MSAVVRKPDFYMRFENVGYSPLINSLNVFAALVLIVLDQAAMVPAVHQRLPGNICHWACFAGKFCESAVNLALEETLFPGRKI